MPKKLTTKKFIERSIKAHGDTYIYGSTTYVDSTTKVTITCKIHGNFQQWPRDHYNGTGCPKCGDKRSADRRRNSTAEFIQKANKVHNNYYSYNKTDYIDTNSKVIITCPKHGDFSQQPNPHIQGAGCPECGKYKQVANREHSNSWSYTQWEKIGLSSSNFTGFKLYILKCWNDTEEFYKVGKTFRDVPKRFSRSKEMPYNWQVESVIQGNARYISELEASIQRNLKEHKYTPEISFHGATECFCVYINIKEYTNDSKQCEKRCPG
jgi:ferredoxin-like protein FixX